jgi:hypothetical protein
VFDVVATAEGFAEARVKEHKLAREGSKPLAIVLQHGRAVKVKVVGAGGTPLSGAAARLISRGGQAADPLDAAKVRENCSAASGDRRRTGLLELGHYAPGAYTLEWRRGLGEHRAPGRGARPAGSASCTRLCADTRARRVRIRSLVLGLLVPDIVCSSLRAPARRRSRTECRSVRTIVVAPARAGAPATESRARQGRRDPRAPGARAMDFEALVKHVLERDRPPTSAAVMGTFMPGILAPELDRFLFQAAVGEHQRDRSTRRPDS